MGIAVSEIMADAVFVENIDLIAGRNGTDRTVRSISIMEVPDFPDGDVGEGMMILTTFSTYKGDVAAMVDAFRKLAAKQISALVVKTKRLNTYLNEIPSELIEAADQNGVPLFLIDKNNIPFREIITSVMTILVNHKYSILVKVNRQYEELYGAIVRRERLSDFIARFSRSTGLSCMCLNSNGEVIARSEVGEAFSVATLQHLIAEIRANDSPLQSNRRYANGQCVVFPAMVNDGIGGYFVVSAGRELGEEQLFFCRQMASFLSIKFLEEYLLLESGQRSTAITVDRILYGVVTDPEGFRLSLESLGFTHQGRMRMVLIRDAAHHDLQSLDAGHYGRFSHFGRYFAREFPGSITHTFATGYIVFLALKRDLPHDALTRKFLAALESPNVGPGFCIGCGSSIDKPTDIPASFAAARSAARYGSIFSAGQRVFFQSDFLEISAVSHLVGTEEHIAIKRSIIAPIKDYDTRHHSDLWSSLEACLTSDSLKQASETLSIHITTLRYRINKIKDLSGADYFRTGGRYLLQTASILDKIE